MKKFLCVFIFVLGSYFYMQAQMQIKTQASELDPVAKAELQGVLADFKTLSLSTQKIIDWGRKAGEKTQLSISIDGQTYTIIAEANYILSPNFKAVMINEKGEELLVNDELLLKSYKGYLKEAPQTKVRFSLTNMGLDLTLYGPEYNTRLSPIRSFGQNNSSADVYLFYDETALLDESACGTPNPSSPREPSPTQGPTPESGSKGGLSPQGGQGGKFSCPENTYYPNSQVISDCRILQIAADADNAMVLFFGGGILGGLTSFSAIFNTIDAAEPAYEAGLNTSFQISQIRVFIPGSSVDPYINGLNLTLDADNQLLIDNVDNIWAGISQADVPRDIVLLFTGQLCLTATSVFRGRVDALGTLCVDEAAAMITRCAFTTGRQITTTAHEIGHTFNASHPNGHDFLACFQAPCNLGTGANSFMCNGSCAAGNINFIDADNLMAMNTHIDNHGDCLDISNLGEIVGPELICAGASASFSTNLNHVSSAGIFSFPNHTWVAGPGLSINSQSPFQLNVSAVNTTSAFISWVEIVLDGIDNCNARIRKQVIVNAKPAFCYHYTVCPGIASDIIFGSASQGATISNIQCINNCNSISFVPVINGSAAFINIISAQPGSYTFSYDITNSCGTHQLLFDVYVPKDCDGPVKGSKREGLIGSTLLELYPNPTQNNLQLSFVPATSGNTKIRLLNAQGQIVLQQEVSVPNAGELTTAKLKLASLAAGVYLVQVQSGEQILTKKLIKQ